MLPNHDFSRPSAAAVVWPRALIVSAICIFASPLAATAGENNVQVAQRAATPIVVPNVDAMRGRKLFVMKGCVTCHSVKGIGGKAAPALDADQDWPVVDLLDFAARMWRGAAAMQELQGIELGYQIELTGAEIGDLAAFAADPTAQQGFSKDEIPDLLKDWFLDVPYWEKGDWPLTDEWRYPDLDDKLE